MTEPDSKAALEWNLADVPGEAMRDWSDAANDANPIHLDPQAADALGFGPRCINPGPANLAYLINMLIEARPDSRILEIDAVFLGNVHAGDHVRAIGRIAPGAPDRCEASLRLMPDESEVLSATIRFEDAD